MDPWRVTECCPIFFFFPLRERTVDPRPIFPNASRRSLNYNHTSSTALRVPRDLSPTPPSDKSGVSGSLIAGRVEELIG